MSYNPAENPRFLPSLDELERTETVMTVTDVTLSRDRLEVVRQTLPILSSIGWSHIVATGLKRREDAQRRALRAESLDELRRAQGELSMLDWLLQLPSSLEAEQHHLVATLRDAGEDDEVDE